MRVSVIIPAFNVEDYVDAAVRSALALDWPDLEVICVDDGSTDNTVTILDDLREEFPSLRVEKGSHGGACMARNQGLREATGEYVQFLDADDLLSPQKLQHQVPLALESDVDIVAGAYWIATMSGEQVATYYPMLTDDPLLALMSTGLGSTCSNLFRTEAVRGIGGWNESKASSQEADLMFRMLVAGSTVTVDNEPHTTVRQGRQDSISASNTARNLLTYASLRQEIVDYVLEDNTRDAQAFVDEFFDVLQRLAEHHPDEADRMYEDTAARGVRPSTNGGTRPARTIALTRLIGFKSTQRLRYSTKRLVERFAG